MTAPSSVPRRPIRRLSRATVERIAAGEVVERPASVVKELVENSIDADATTVTVRLEGGGLERVEVADDGLGIPPEELELAVERHATNKIDPDGPVERVTTLGFRGEALASIAAVARLRILSRTPGRDLAEGISVVGGTPTGRYGAPRAPGTTVEVEDLFFNTPARRKFLRSPAAEQVEVAQTLERMYLARPNVALFLESENRLIASFPATSDLADAAARVLGPEFLHGSFSLSAEIPGGRVHAVLGRPSLAAASFRSLFVAVDGRPVVSRPVQQAVRAAFADHLPRTRFPVGVVHLEVAPDRLDVNVHPTKREVRLVRERDVTEAVRVRVRAAWASASHVAEVPAGALPPRAGPEPYPELPEPFAKASVVPPSSSAAPARQSTLEGLGPAGPSVVVPRAAGHPRLVLLGCVQALYWVAESDEGLVLVDQHAASERVLYETLRREEPVARQTLVEPVPVTLTASERAALKAHAHEVARAGFEVDEFGPNAYCVRSVPSFAGRRAPPAGVTELLGELASGGRPTLPDGLRERALATLACHAAIRAGDPVPLPEFSRVLDALYALPEPAYSCPHGRPIILGIPRSRLDRWFLRSGP